MLPYITSPQCSARPKFEGWFAHWSSPGSGAVELGSEHPDQVRRRHGTGERCALSCPLRAEAELALGLAGHVQRFSEVIGGRIVGNVGGRDAGAQNV